MNVHFSVCCVVLNAITFDVYYSNTFIIVSFVVGEVATRESDVR